MKDLKDSSGNILFLILIAVALFAALSFAITQSTHSNGGNAGREETTVNSSVLQQYTASVRGAVTRMLVNEVDITELQFNPPSDFSSLTSPSFGVFNPSGGSIIHQIGPLSIIDGTSDNPSGQWVFTMHFEVDNIGTSAAGSLNGNDLLALLVGVKQTVCEQMNLKLGIPVSPFPTISGTTYSSDLIANMNTYYMDNDYVLPATESVIGAGVGDSALSGLNEGCYYESSADDYVYFSVISGR